MTTRLHVLALLAVLLLIGSACTQAGRSPERALSPAIPGLVERQSRAGGTAGRYLWAYHLVIADSTGEETEVVPLRIVTKHWNVLKFLEQGPCTNCVAVLGMIDSDHGTKLFDVRIRHPFDALNLTGFDVRGIAMFRGTHSFPAAALTTPDRNAGDGELVNADGYTTLYNITTMGAGPAGLEGYLKGKFAATMAPNATLNGYKRHSSPGVTNVRKIFNAGDDIVETYDIDMPDGQFIFGYAVDASWAPPTNKPVTDPASDFPPEANCSEPWKIEVTENPIGTGLTDLGGETLLYIDVYDHQGRQTHAEPVLECPELFNGTLTGSWSEDGDGYARYLATVPNTKPAPAGEYRCLISVEDDDNASSPAWLDLTAYQIHTLDVNPKGWARTWGGSEYDWVKGVALDESGDVYTAGHFVGTVDFDPGTGQDKHTCDGGGGYVSKFNSAGEHQWARTWGGLDVGEWAQCCAIAMSESGEIYTVGEYNGDIDFDPGPGSDPHSGNGVFLSKLDTSGEYYWSRTWGALDALGVAVDDYEDVYVVGWFQGTKDFDPGPGVDEYTAHSLGDPFLSKFDSDGEYLWGRTWGGPLGDGGDKAHSLAVDNVECVYVTGEFFGTVDFDPGTGTDEHSAYGGNMSSDVFVTKFDSAGDHQWARTWGGQYDDIGHSATVASPGMLLVSGYYQSTADFDPGDGTDEHISNGHTDIFLSCFDLDGEFRWARTWGGGNYDEGHAVGVDASGNSYTTGSFQLSVDFDPGPGVDSHESVGGNDVFLSKFDSDGEFMWARTWGGASGEEGLAVAAGGLDGVYVGGRFFETVDFDPGPGVDEHTSNGQIDAFLSRFAPNGNW